MATYPVYPATTFTQAVELTIFASNQLHDVINGDALTTVETENGDIPTLRKALVDNFYFKTPINWVEGESATVFNQLYYFDGTLATSGWYYAPQATLDNPIAMGSTPLNDDNWRLYQTAKESIPAQVYPWYTEITQVTSSITPPYEFDTAIVVFNGVVLVPGADRDYTISDNVITFNTPLEPEPNAEYPDILFCYIGKVEEGNAETNYVTYASLAVDAAAALIGTASGSNLQELLNKGASGVPLTQGGFVQNALWYVTPEMFGAKGDGITDDIIPLNLAIAFAANSGVEVRFQAKTYAIGSVLILPSYTKLLGVEGISKIKALSSWNDAVLKTQNAPAGDYLVVSDSSAMVNGVFIENLIIESGWDGTTSNTITHTECLRVYGAGTKIKGVRVGYCRGMGANLGGRGNTSIKYAAPSIYEDIRVDMVGQHGITIGGSSDNHTSKIIVRNASLLGHNTYDGIRFGGGGGTRGDQFHVWQSGDAAITPLYQNRIRYGLYLASYDSLITNCHFEGCASAQIIFVGARNSVINTRCYSNWQAGASVIMLADANTFEGYVGAPINNTLATDVHALQLGDSSNAVKNCRADIYVYGCKFLNYVNSTGRNSIYMRGDLSLSSASGLGTIVTGTIPDTDVVEISSPQYTGKRFATNVVISNDHSLSVKDISGSGNLSSGGVVTLSGLTSTVPTVTGQLYVDANGFVKIKL